MSWYQLVYQVSLLLKYVSIYFFTIELEQVISRANHSYLNHLIKQSLFFFFLFSVESSPNILVHFPFSFPYKNTFWSSLCNLETKRKIQKWEL